MKKNILFLLIFFSLYLWAGCAFAQAADAGGGSDPIFQSLANKAGVIGKGLRDFGYAAAGLGLIVFSFMAIFNKISWKTLAYIMFSSFILSVMVATIKYISNDKANISFGDSGAGDLSFGDTLSGTDSSTNETTPPEVNK